MAIEYQNQKANEDRFREKLKIKSRSKFVGVRQRASGKWAAEIKDTSKKIRMWLGTYQTAEEAARAYDEAAFLLRGSNTRTNFSTHDIATNSPISLKLRNLLDRKAFSNQIQVQNKSSIVSPTFLSAEVATINSSIMALEHNSACSSEGKSLFWLQNQASDNLFGIDMNMITAANTSQFDYFWPLAQQSINNELTVPKDGFNVERQLSTMSAMNECNVEDTYEGYKYEHDVNYPLSQFFCFN